MTEAEIRRAFEIVGYVDDGGLWCVSCLTFEGCDCPPDQRDENGICAMNCSGDGPHSVVRGELRADFRCMGCGQKLKDVARSAESELH